MHVVWRRAAAAMVSGAAAAMVCACSTVTPQREPNPLSVGSVADLARGCVDMLDGFPDAAKYTGKGPHRMAIFAKDLGTDQGATGAGDPPKYELANDGPPDDVMETPKSPREVALLACGTGLPGHEKLNTCQYNSALGTGIGPPAEIPLYSQLYSFTVYELRTGRVVDKVRLESRMAQPASSCPVTISGGTMIYAKAQPYELNDLFEPFVTGPAR